jgi:hypothetical protein
MAQTYNLLMISPYIFFIVIAAVIIEAIVFVIIGFFMGKSAISTNGHVFRFMGNEAKESMQEPEDEDWIREALQEPEVSKPTMKDFS